MSRAVVPKMTAVLRGAMIEDLGEIETLVAQWDALAEASRLPTMTPAWVLAWWKHFAPPGASPRIVTVTDGDELVGLAPFYVQPGAHRRVDYRLPGIELAVRLAPLARPDSEWAVAREVAAVLDRASPRPDVIALEGLPLASHWVAALRDGWPGPIRPAGRLYTTHRCPTIPLAAGTFDDWLAGRSAHFRERARRARRRFEKAGGTRRWATPETLEADVDTLMRLHTGRWQVLGESNLARRPEQTRGLLLEAGRRLASDRFRLMILEVEGEPMGAYLSLAAGGELLGVNGGWSSDYGRLSPFLVHFVYLIEDALARGDCRIDMGIGTQEYKSRMSSGIDPVAWAILVVPGRRMGLTALRVAPMLARYGARDAAKRALGTEGVDRLRVLRSSLRDRLRRGGGHG